RLPRPRGHSPDVAKGGTRALLVRPRRGSRHRTSACGEQNRHHRVFHAGDGPLLSRHSRPRSIHARVSAHRSLGREKRGRNSTAVGSHFWTSEPREGLRPILPGRAEWLRQSIPINRVKKKARSTTKRPESRTSTRSCRKTQATEEKVGYAR